MLCKSGETSPNLVTLQWHLNLGWRRCTKAAAWTAWPFSHSKCCLFFKHACALLNVHFAVLLVAGSGFEHLTL